VVLGPVLLALKLFMCSWLVAAAAVAAAAVRPEELAVAVLVAVLALFLRLMFLLLAPQLGLRSLLPSLRRRLVVLVVLAQPMGLSALSVMILVLEQ